MVNKIALGTAQFGLDYGIANKIGRVQKAGAAEILELAKSLCIDTLDTATAYGESEKALGSVGVEGWQVISKLSALPVDIVDVDGWIEGQVYDSCQRLKVDNLYGLLLHRPVQLVEARGEEIRNALYKLKQNGWVKKIGVSVYEPAELDPIFSMMKVDLVQAPFSIVDQRLAESGWIKRLQDKGCELHVRSVFLQGLLLMSSEQRPSQFGRWEALWDTWDAWLKETGLTALEACLRYVLSIEGISKVVLGVESASQLKEIFIASSGSLPAIPGNLALCDKELLNPALWVNK
ncbi:MAG TPA: aldo/keto reductase [Rhodospirillales bacterium]|nr:aldo/keto reductase [Rhodospirillales bacterium]